ncbi:MAG: cupin domain-containing protein [Gallionella sp.]|nr:cupin domain-containing protein [Gallionella sp.]MDD4946417.1 cupin domain-containing protein [Gallionella sp.]MDD5611686.1 cupin domain-containing protein [Gallionella sp.]
MKNTLPMLGNLTVNEFLRDYWQKKPLLIRGAFPEFNGLLSPKAAIELACTEDVQARLVTQPDGQFELQHSPFTARDFKGLSKMPWTVLVQGLNHHLPEAAELLKHFDFIPHTRLDDLMVSYAPRGGGVGPHFDSYDVFLLQGLGHRRWQISTQSDHTLIEGAPLRILKDFKVEQEWVLAPGDMLYLPPHCAHNGVAEDDCMTYSIGFRTPAYQELAEQFLIYLQDRICVEGMYADPDLKTQPHPSEISAAMLRQVEQAIRQVRWDKEDVANFLGCYLSEPKPHIYFEPPEPPLSEKKFLKAINANGLLLDLKSQLLCHDNDVFMNGEATPGVGDDYALLRELADRRALPALAGSSGATSAELCGLLYEWYLDGFIHPA